jgi:hypothetical protein
MEKGIEMKSRLAVYSVVCILVASALAASYMGYTAVLATPTHGFTLTLTGTAYAPQKHMYVKVTLSLIGSADGKLKTVVTLHVKGGGATVNSYGTFSVSHGCGQLVMRCHYFALSIWLTPKYGGKTAIWCMSGRTGTLSGQTLKVSLYASHVILPTTGYPRLDKLYLSGTITPLY